MEGKKFLSPRGMVLCGALLLAAGALYLALSLLPQGTVAVVEQNGQEVARRELSQLAGPETLSLTGENGVEVTITFTPQGAAVTASTCPDQVCVQTGQLTRAGESMPERLMAMARGSLMACCTFMPYSSTLLIMVATAGGMAREPGEPTAMMGFPSWSTRLGEMVERTRLPGIT